MFKHTPGFAIGALAIALASCGGGGGVPSGGVPQSTASPTPSAPPSTASPGPTSESTTAPLSTSATTSVTLGGVSGVQTIDNASVTLPQVSVASNASVTLTSAVPSGVPTPSIAIRSFTTKTRKTLGATATPLAYVSMTFSNTVAVTSSPAFSVTFSAPLPGGNYYVAVFDPTGTIGVGWQLLAGPVSGGSSTLTFGATTYAPPVIFTSGVAYVFSVVSTASALTMPVPIQASPAALSFEGTGTYFAQSVALSQAGYAGAFTGNASLCANVATVTAGEPPGTFTVTPTSVGTCTMYFSNSNGTAIGVPITVTATQFVGQ